MARNNKNEKGIAMAKKEKFCYECDVPFTVKGPLGFEVNYCPACGEELGSGEDNEFEDEELDE
jgi:uncharacterized paraquat-inducible protein A